MKNKLKAFDLFYKSLLGSLDRIGKEIDALSEELREHRRNQLGPCKWCGSEDHDSNVCWEPPARNVWVCQCGKQNSKTNHECETCRQLREGNKGCQDMRHPGGLDCPHTQESVV